MWRRSAWSTGKFSLFLVLGWAQAAVAADPAPGAGPIVMQVTPCLIAHKTGKGETCPMPPLPEEGNSTQHAAAHMKRALFFIDLEELRKALAEVDVALEIDPGSLEARLLAARLARTLPDLVRAEREIALAMQQAPDDLDVRATHAELLRTRAAPLEALREFDAILEKAPGHAYSHNARATILVELGRAEEALGDLDFLLKRNLANPDLLARRAHIYLALDRPNAARADFDTILNQDAHSLDALTGRATAHLLSGNDDAALSDYDAILGPVGGEPNYALGGDLLGKYLMQRALILVRFKRFEEAATDMTRAMYTGASSILRAQVFLRQHGFGDIPLDGRDSTAFRAALRACFGLNACFSGFLHAI